MHPAAPKRGAKALVSAYIVARCFLNALRLSSKWPRQRHARFALDPPGNPSSSRASWTRIYVGVAAPRTSNVSSYSWKPKGNLARRRVWESHLSFRQLPLPPTDYFAGKIIATISTRGGKWRGSDEFVLWRPTMTYVRFFLFTIYANHDSRAKLSQMIIVNGDKGRKIDG